MHFAIVGLSIAVIVLLVLFLCACAVIAVKKKESPVAAATELKQNFVDEAKRGEAGAVAEFQKLDQAALSFLHMAEQDGGLYKGTLQRYVDAHIAGVESAIPKAPAEV